MNRDWTLYGVCYDGTMWFLTIEGKPVLSFKNQSEANRMCEHLSNQQIFYLTPVE